MEFIRPGSISVVVFLLVNAFVLAALFGGIFVTSARAKREVVSILLLSLSLVVLWLGVGALTVASGIMNAFPIPVLPIFLITMIGVPIVFALSPYGLDLAKSIPLPALVAFQGFRLILELVLHSWVEQGSIPGTMTWTGQNFDIVSGILALLVAPVAGQRPSFAWVFNVVGLGLLLNVTRVAILSSPLPFAWNTTPPLLLAFHFPYFIIVPICVGGAFAGHILLTRALLLRSRVTVN